MAQMRFGFLAGLFGLAQVVLQLTQALLAMLDALLDPGDIATHRIEAALHQIEAFRQVMVAVTQALDAGIGVALLGHQRLKADLLGADHRFTLADLLVEGLPAQGRQLRLELALLAPVLLVFLRSLGLALQAFELAFEFFAQVGQAFEVLVGAPDTGLGFTTALLVFGDAGGLFDEVAQIFGTRLDQFGDHPLLDDRIAARAQPGAEEDIGDIPAPALGTVEVIRILRVAGDLAADGNLRVRGVLAHQGTVAVVEDQLDAGLADRLATGGAIENDVGHRLAAQILGRALTHHPAHGIDNVGFATAVRADDGRHVAGEIDGGGVDERLEPGQLDRFEPHGQPACNADKTCSQLRAPYSVSTPRMRT